MSETYLFFVCILVASQVFEAYGGGGSCYAAPNFFGPECRSSTSIIGSNNLKVRYSVNVKGNGGTLVCCEGYSPVGTTFQSIGCGHSSFGGTVNWGNIIATPKIKCKGSPFGATVSWQH